MNVPSKIRRALKGGPKMARTVPMTAKQQRNFDHYERSRRSEAEHASRGHDITRPWANGFFCATCNLREVWDA